MIDATFGSEHAPADFASQRNALGKRRDCETWTIRLMTERESGVHSAISASSYRRSTDSCVVAHLNSKGLHDSEHFGGVSLRLRSTVCTARTEI